MGDASDDGSLWERAPGAVDNHHGAKPWGQSSHTNPEGISSITHPAESVQHEESGRGVSFVPSKLRGDDVSAGNGGEPSLEQALGFGFEVVFGGHDLVDEGVWIGACCLDVRAEVVAGPVGCLG